MNKDTWRRAWKTFVQSCLGVIIPEVCIILNDITKFDDINAIWMILAPVICSALAAGISALWNTILEAMDKPK